MKRRAGLLLTVTAVQAMAAAAVAATAYVSDELVLGVYADENGQGQRLATLHSGATLETLGVGGEFTQVRLPDGTTGWVKSSYLTTQAPAVVRIKQLEQELDLSHATTPALAEAAARNEVSQLKRELDAARPVAGRDPTPAAGTAARHAVPLAGWLAGGGILAALVGGFWLGYATLARRVRSRFGGLRVY